MRELLTTTEAGQRLGVTGEAVRLMSERGVLKPAKVTPGGHRRYRREDVEALAEAREPDEVRKLREALDVYRRMADAGQHPAIAGPHVLLAAVEALRALGGRASSLDMRAPDDWGRLAKLANLDRDDAELLVEVGETMVQLAGVPAA